jgi:hypothetical protein
MGTTTVILVFIKIYKNIYEAIENYRSVEGWNWWEGYWGFV